ncbi:hypothetical protein MJO28_011459 [Puccinia striiformis f. sp. tritici]|uniref:Uncharacterized protein n=1 Tax=Puccinia striiformis f. sp. tritici TaxID=168172 RepID=A0ACC0E2R8_9BASI|nr:hypothetical protein MJO28_011459 [Puccinia striiformis f. sp. tritici]
MDWVMDELLHPKGSLPVFGKVENVIQTLDKKLFGDLQVFIINYFSLSTTMVTPQENLQYSSNFYPSRVLLSKFDSMDIESRPLSKQLVKMNPRMAFEASK